MYHTLCRFPAALPSMASAASPIPRAFHAHKRLRTSQNFPPVPDLANSHQLCIPGVSTTLQPRLFQSIAAPQSSHKVRDEVKTLNVDESRPAEGVAQRWKSAEELHLEAIRELPDYNDLFKDPLVRGFKQTTSLTPEQNKENLAAVDEIQIPLPSKDASTDNPHPPELSQEDDSKMEMNTLSKEEHMTANKDLSLEQKIRMELNKAAALAKRNLRICEENVAEAQAQGRPLPKFESLLVEKKWLEAFQGELQKPYMESLHQYVSQEVAGKIPIYPPPAKIFNAFNSCPFDKVKVVIIGQDPYHGPGQATGLCFSVEKGVKLPSSLGNIFKEIQNDIGCSFPSHGNLEKWAHQGVLLLNTVLTVREHHANSHAKKGWEPFTDAAIRAIAQQRSGLVFLLWGNSAQEKIRLINKTKHHILKAVHPSGISAHRGFFDCRHFSKTNKNLEDQGLLPIDWQL